jgi:hypothetical protein
MGKNFKERKWCWENGIRIYPHPLNKNGTKLAIVIEKNGNETIGKGIYSDNDVYEKINELYLNLFKKHGK